MSVRATVNRKGTLVATGPIGIQPLTARLRVEARALDIAPVQRFIDDKVNVTVTSGLLSTVGRLSMDLAPGKPMRAAYAGELHLADFAAVDKTSQQDLLKWRSLFVGGVDFDLEPLKVSVGEVALADFYSRFIVNADGTLNLQNILVKEGEAGTSTTTPATTAASARSRPTSTRSRQRPSPRNSLPAHHSRPTSASARSRCRAATSTSATSSSGPTTRRTSPASGAASPR